MRKLIGTIPKQGEVWLSDYATLKLCARCQCELAHEPHIEVIATEPDGRVRSHQLLDAMAKMADKNVGSLVVMEGERLVGIITERHYSRNVVLKGKTSPTTLVREIMETNVIHVRPEQPVELCMTL